MYSQAEPHVRPISCHIASLSWQEPEKELMKLLLMKVSDRDGNIKGKNVDCAKLIVIFVVDKVINWRHDRTGLQLRPSKQPTAYAANAGSSLLCISVLPPAADTLKLDQHYAWKDVRPWLLQKQDRYSQTAAYSWAGGCMSDKLFEECVLVKVNKSLWSPYVIGGPLYFCPVVSFYLSIFYLSFFSSPNLSGHRLDV